MNDQALKRAEQRRAHPVRLFHKDHHQALRIPHGLEFHHDDVIVRKEGQRLIVEPASRPNDLAELLASWEPLDDTFPEVDETLLPLDVG